MKILRFGGEFINDNVRDHLDGLHLNTSFVSSKTLQRYRETLKEFMVLVPEIARPLLNDPIYQRYLGILDMVENVPAWIFTSKEGVLISLLNEEDNDY